MSFVLSKRTQMRKRKTRKTQKSRHRRKSTKKYLRKRANHRNANIGGTKKWSLNDEGTIITLNINNSEDKTRDLPTETVDVYKQNCLHLMNRLWALFAIPVLHVRQTVMHNKLSNSHKAITGLISNYLGTEDPLYGHIRKTNNQQTDIQKFAQNCIKKITDKKRKS